MTAGESPALKTMKITVTQEHIEKGDKCSDWSCPIALAINDIDKFWNVSVGDNEIVLNETSYTAPPTVTSFVQRFDGGLTVAPFEFVLAV